MLRHLFFIQFSKIIFEKVWSWIWVGYEVHGDLFGNYARICFEKIVKNSSYKF